MADPDFEQAKAELAAALDARMADLVNTIYGGTVSILRSDEFGHVKSKVTGGDYKVNDIIAFTDLHTSNLEGAIRWIVDKLGGEIVPGGMPDTFIVRDKVPPAGA